MTEIYFAGITWRKVNFFMEGMRFSRLMSFYKQENERQNWINQGRNMIDIYIWQAEV